MYFITQWGTGGTGNGEFNDLHDIAIDSANTIFVSDKVHFKL